MSVRDAINEIAESNNEENEDTQSSTPEENQEETTEESEEWQPDYSYSVRNEQREFDEWIRPAITDPDTEKNIRQLYTKAEGLDHIKSNLEQERERAARLEAEREQARQEAELARNGVEGLKKLAKDDFASFAHMAGIDDQTILTYANRRLDYKEKPEHERRMLDQDMERRTQAYQHSIEAENLRQQNYTLMKQAHETKLGQALQNPEIAQFQKVFDERMGEGAFRTHVNNYGSTQFRTTQQYVEPQVAVQQIYSQFRPLFMDKLETINQDTKKSQPKNPPTNLGTGRTTSVVKKRVKSLSDLRKKANEIAKREGYGGGSM